jgi:hypothetical protein
LIVKPILEFLTKEAELLFLVEKQQPEKKAWKSILSEASVHLLLLLEFEPKDKIKIRFLLLLNCIKQQWFCVR